MDARFADALRELNAAIVLQFHVWMPRPLQLFAKIDPIVFVYESCRIPRRQVSIYKSCYVVVGLISILET